jgi:hypothetical protein
VDGQTDMTKLNVVFHNFANAPNKKPPKTQQMFYHTNGLAVAQLVEAPLYKLAGRGFDS